MRVPLLIFFMLIFAVNDARSQGFSMGYNIGKFTIPQRNFEILEYEYSAFMPGFKIPQTLFGASLGFRYGEENYFAEFLFTNKKNTTDKYSYTGLDGYKYEFEMKTRLRTFNMGAAFGTKLIKFGASIDLGIFKIFSKAGLIGSDPGWNNFYDRHELMTGMTFFIPVQLSVLEIRPYYQLPFFYETFNGGISDFTHRSNNMGINISLVLDDF